MKATVYYDTHGVIQSVVSVHPDAQTMIHNEEYDSIEVALKDNRPNLLFQIHSQYRVDTIRRKLIRRTTAPRNTQDTAS